MRSTKTILGTTIMTALLGVTGSAMASSHREAPAIAEDQYADNTDVYAFISPEDPDRIVFIANYVPLLSPASGPNYYRFSDHVLYEIRVDNDGDAVADISYEFRFSTTTRTGMTFLYNTGAVTAIDDTDLNVRQTYTLTRRNLSGGGRTVVAMDVPVAPWDVGRRSFPDAAAGSSGYTAVAAGAIRATGTTTSFAGPRREAFQVDFNVFDLLGLGPRVSSASMGGAAYPNGDLRPNYATSFNVMTLAISVPITEVAAGGVRPTATSMARQKVVGVYATASRRQVQILRRGRRPDHEGQWTQVSRLGIPLVNEVLIPLANKDNFNRTSPANDATNYGMTILNPELNGLLGAVLPELGCPATAAGGNPTILAIIQGLGAGTVPSDMLRLDITAGQTFTNSAFPNGRTLHDDVLTAEVNVICTADPAMPLPVDVIGGPECPGISAAFPYMPAPIRPD